MVRGIRMGGETLGAGADIEEGFMDRLKIRWRSRKKRTWKQRLQSWFSLARLIAIMILLGLGVVRTLDILPLQPLRVKTFDLYQRLKPRESKARPVSIVDLDVLFNINKQGAAEVFNVNSNNAPTRLETAVHSYVSKLKFVSKDVLQSNCEMSFNLNVT